MYIEIYVYMYTCIMHSNVFGMSCHRHLMTCQGCASRTDVLYIRTWWRVKQ